MGTPASVREPVDAVRKRFPGFLKLPMLMVGGSAGEGDIALDTVSGTVDWTIDALREVLPLLAKRLKAMMVLFKDYPKWYRPKLDQLLRAGFTRIPSMPATGFKLDFPDFEEYLTSKLSHAMRKNLRRKFRKSESGGPSKLEVVNDISPRGDEILPVFPSVFGRANQRLKSVH